MKDAQIFGMKTDGTITPLQMDSSGNIKFTNATLQAGEDLTNDVTKVEERFSYQNISSAAGTAVKSAAGFLHQIQVNNPGNTWEIDIYDGTTSAGTKIAAWRAIGSTAVTLRYDVSFATGLFIDTVKYDGAFAGDITVSYR